MSDTPRTDAKRFEVLSEMQSGRRWVVPAEFAMELERELNEAKAKLASVQTICERCGNYLPGHATGAIDICTCRK